VESNKWFSTATCSSLTADELGIFWVLLLVSNFFDYFKNNQNNIAIKAAETSI
jgi:hypothetical protein